MVEGIVIGGGAALASIYREYRDELKGETPDEQKGISAVFEATLKPLYQIAENAGYDGDQIVSRQLTEGKNIGFDAKKGEWVDMFEAGIVDPTKVTRNALLNAAYHLGTVYHNRSSGRRITGKERSGGSGNARWRHVLSLIFQLTFCV